MRLLLVQLPTSYLGSGEKVFPLGLARLAGVLGGRVPLDALDMNLADDPWPLLRQRLHEFAPDTVALSFRNLDPLAGHAGSYLPSLVTAARLVRRLRPAARIIAGGPAFSLFAGRLLTEIPEIDAGMAGEAEATFSRLIDPATDPAGLPGAVWRRGRRLRINPPRSDLSLDRLPPADLERFAPDDYIGRNGYVAAFGIEGKRGCDLSCAYCVYPRISGGCMRLRPPAAVADDIERLHKGWGVALFHFTDAVVNRPPEHFEAVCREIASRRLAVQWTGFFRENHLSSAQLALARDAGLAAIYFSADALTDRGLKVLRKQMSCDDITRAARLAAASGILTVCHFLVNLPGESAAEHERARALLEKIIDIHSAAGNLGAVVFNTVRLYPGAPLTRTLVRNGELPADTDLLYPCTYDPPVTSGRRHELEILCHSAGTFARLGLPPAGERPAT